MAQPTFAQHAIVQQDGQGNPFLTYTSSGGGVLFQISSTGTISNQGGVAGVGLGAPVTVAQVNASLGFAIFNTAAAVTLLPSTLVTGVYRLSLYMVYTTTFVTNTEGVITFGYADGSGAQTLAYTSGALTAGTVTQGIELVSLVTGTALTYTPSKTGSAATVGVASVSILVERVI